jgi:hypothetical protein
MYETNDRMERSHFTLHLYLSDSIHQPSGEQLEGGATTFWSMNMANRFDVQPKMGRVLVFQQRFLIHAGDDVIRGIKLTMRTDIMYSKVEGEEAPEPELESETQPASMMQKAFGWVSKQLEG